jgi:pimeloyl-ACP methyl ester carboxylesterase
MLLGKLSDRPAHLVGFSYGGWVAMNQAIHAPGRVASITLLDPAGLVQLDARFYRWLSITGLATLTPMPLRRRLTRWLDAPGMLSFLEQAGQAHGEDAGAAPNVQEPSAAIQAKFLSKKSEGHTVKVFRPCQEWRVFR